MRIEVRPATVFEDVAAVVGPRRPDANVCWCLSYRIGSKENLQLRGPTRGERVRELVGLDPPPGVLAYEGDEVVGWAAECDHLIWPRLGQKSSRILAPPGW